MTAILFQELQFFDLNGDPLANGNVYFYQSDGSTPQNAFTDSTGGVALSNPSLLNSAGRPNSGNGIWLGLNLTYTLVIKDSAGSTIYTISNLTATPAGLAPNNASYITASAETGLSNERVLTGTANQITVTDGGSTATLSVPYQFNLGSSATGPSELRLFEDTDNGSNKGIITVASSLTADRTYTFPDATGAFIPANTSTGSAGQSIIMVGSTPTWTNSTVYLTRATAVAAARLDVGAILSSSYNYYLVVFDGILPANDGSFLRLNFGTGATTPNTSANYTSIADGMVTASGAYSTSIAGATGQAYGDLHAIASGAGMKNSTTPARGSGHILISAFGGLNSAVHYQGQIRYLNVDSVASNYPVSATFGGTFDAATAAVTISSLHLSMSAGNISGSAVVYGITSS